MIRIGSKPSRPCSIGPLTGGLLIGTHLSNWVNGGVLSFPATIMKSGRPHSIPLTGYGQYLPEQSFAFNSWSKSKVRFDKACGVTDWVLHDFRRYFSSTMARLGVPLHITEQIIDHRSQLTGVAAIYNRYDYLAEMKDALERYEAHIFGVVKNAGPAT